MSKKENLDFSKAVQGAVAKPAPGKTRITIRLDNDVLSWFRDRVHRDGGGNYQSNINTALREYIDQQDKTLEKTLRNVIREELKSLMK